MTTGLKFLKSKSALLGVMVLSFGFFSKVAFDAQALAQSAATQSPVNFDLDRLRATDELQKLVENLTEKAVLVENLKDNRKPVVRLELNIDKGRVLEAYKKHDEQQRAREEQQKAAQWQESTNRYLGFLKAAQEIQNQNEKTAVTNDNANGNQAPTLNELAPRFGILNTGPVIAVPQNAAPAGGESQPRVPAAGISPNINFSAPSMTFFPVPFTYSVLEYANEVMISIHVPAEFKPEKRNELKDAIVKLLGLPILKAENADQKIKFTELIKPEEAKKDEKKDVSNPAAAQPSWGDELMNPKNQSLSGLFMSAAALLGFLLVGAALFMAGKGVSAGLAGIAQAAQASKAEGSGGEGARQEGEAAQTPANDDGGQAADAKSPVGSGGRSKFSSDKEADLLAQTRLQIVENVGQWCQKDPVTVGEVLNELANAENGMATLNSLLLYTGYESLKPALELLPEKLLKKLDESLNDSWKEGAELLPGLEAAQLLLAGMIPRQTALLRFAYDTTALRKSLMKLDSFNLKELMNGLSAADAASVFRILPQGVAVAVSTQISADKMRSVMEELTKNKQEIGPDPTVLEKITIRGNAAESGSGADKDRLLRAMLKKTNTANENKVLELLGPADLMLRFELLQERFFLKDLEFVEPSLIRAVLDKLPLARKANFMFFSDATMRQSILDLYPKGSKTLEALLEELENIERSAKRKIAANADKSAVMGYVSEKIFDSVRTNLKIRLSIIEKISKAYNASLPDELARLLAENEEAAA
ncbi:MAG: hypothetical protein RL189_2162 [Pseudomonadota bacterium]|jgi:hypothetical protein